VEYRSEVLSSWETVALSVFVAILTTMVAPFALQLANRHRERRIAKGLIAHEIERLREIIDFGLSQNLGGGWAERGGITPPLPIWTEYQDVLYDAVSSDVWGTVRDVHVEWDRLYLVFGQENTVRRELKPLVELSDKALNALDPALAARPRVHVAKNAMPPLWELGAQSAAGTASPPIVRSTDDRSTWPGGD
jgi:hypothetical protein